MTKSSPIKLEIIEVVEEVVVTRTEINPQVSPPQNPYLEVAPKELFNFKVWVKNEGTKPASPTVQLIQDGVDIPGQSYTFISIPVGVEESVGFPNISAPATGGEYLIGAKVI